MGRVLTTGLLDTVNWAGLQIFVEVAMRLLRNVSDKFIIWGYAQMKVLEPSGQKSGLNEGEFLLHW